MFDWAGLRKRGTRTVCSRSCDEFPWNVLINFDTPVELRRWSVSLVNKPLLDTLFGGDGDFFLITFGSIRISSGSTIGFILNSVTCGTGEFCWLFEGDSLGDERFVVVNGGDARFLNVVSVPFDGLCCWDDNGDERLLTVVESKSKRIHLLYLLYLCFVIYQNHVYYV